MIGAKGYSHGFIERRTPMKLACTSGSLHREIESGELTQLEFVDLCARELTCDGIVLDARHFPRTDDDYLAQIKKMATDRGLSIAALSDAAFFSETPEYMAAAVDRALAIGAPLLAAPVARETECSWSDQLARLGIAASLAKARNVTLALRNAPNTFAATTHDCKRVAKETDSAWLRFGPEPLRLDVASDASALAPNTVLLWTDVRLESERSIPRTLATFSDFRGHLAVDELSGEASVAQLLVSLRRWRAALAGAERE
jgi:hypothetical protein